MEKNAQKKFKKIGLVTTSQVNLGIRALAGYLQDAGYETGMFSLRKKDGSEYSENEIDGIMEGLSSYDLIGITTTDYTFEKVAVLAKAIKERLDKPVILGGDHAKLDPQDAFLAHVDAVCLGDGESGLIELLENWDIRLERNNPNFIVKAADIENINKLRVLPLENIDAFHSDLSYANCFILEHGKLVPWTAENSEDFDQHQIGHKDTIIYAWDRGCPRDCTYCHNGELIKINLMTSREQGLPVVKPLRRKSIEVAVDELVNLKNANPQAKFLNIMNNDTAAIPLSGLQKFAKEYKEKVGLPFYCMVSPQALSGPDGYAKVQALIDAGMKELNMGIQTNEKTNREVFNRKQSDKMLQQVVEMLNEFARKDPAIQEDGKIDLLFDFIIHNPFETEDDVIQTIKMVQKFPRPFDFVSHTLFVGRATTLRKMLEKKREEDGVIGVETDRVPEDDKSKVSNFHDTETFLEYLGKNRGFYINSVCEFSAGRHNSKMTGRIPRQTKDLLHMGVFAKIIANNNDFAQIVSEVDTKGESLNFLINKKVRKYFNENPDKFKSVFLEMHQKHPIRYTNQVDNF